MVTVKANNAISAVEKAIKALTALDITPVEARRIRARWRQKMLVHIRREAVPAMKSITPKRTGTAARSIRAKPISRPYGIEVGPGRKGFYLAFLPNVDDLAREYRNILADVWRKWNADALNDSIREVLNL